MKIKMRIKTTKKRRNKKRITKIVLGFLVGIVIFLGINFLWKFELKEYENISIYDRNGILLYTQKTEWEISKNFKTLDEVPLFIKKIILFREDKRFFQHWGIDGKATIRAFRENIKNGKIIQGASTIDQQVIKLSEQAFERNLSQKIRENLLALNINMHYNKKEILLYYINSLPFGKGQRGFSSACNFYFGRECKNLNKGELIFLFTLAKWGRFDNFSSQAYTFAQKIGETSYSKKDFQKIYHTCTAHETQEKKAAFFVNWIIKKNEEKNKEKIKKGEERESKKIIQTDFDYPLYEKIQERLISVKNYLKQKGAEDACVIVMNKNQKIVSMNILRSYGSKDYGFINGCLSPRQVGSAMKPFLYAFAFEILGYTWGTKIQDLPVNYLLDDGGKYSPKNFDLQYHWEVSLNQALGSSLNIPSVKILEEVGLENYWDFLKKLSKKVKSKIIWDEDPRKYGLSLALGTKEISPLEFTKLWTIFSNENEKEIRNNKKKSSRNTIKNILSNNQYRLLSFPINNWLNSIWTFAKTGTSRGFRDGWTCGGFTNSNENIICVWAGNYNGKPMKQSGSNTAGVIWANVIELMKK